GVCGDHRLPADRVHVLLHAVRDLPDRGRGGGADPAGHRGAHRAAGGSGHITDRMSSVRSWSSPSVPALPAGGLPPRSRDTVTGELTQPIPGEQARIYVCGITPYD